MPQLGCRVEPWFSRGHKDVSPSSTVAKVLKRAIGPDASGFIRSVKRSLARAQESQPAESEVAQADTFASEVGALIKSVAPGPGDRLFFPNVLWNEAVCLVREIQSAELDAIAEVQILLRFDPPTLPGAAELLASVGQARGVTWLADTEELAEAYSALLQSSVRRVRVPIEGAVIRKAAAMRRNPDPVVVLALGESRREKGFHLLPETVERSIALDSGIEYWIQLSENVPGGEPGIVEAMSKLRRLQGRNVKLLPAKIASTAFVELLGQAHVLLLPYDAKSYSRRSSGMLVHGLAAGLVVVMPRDAAALSSCVESNGRASQAVLFDGSRDGLVSAVVHAVNRVRATDAPNLQPLAEEELPAPWADLI